MKRRITSTFNIALWIPFRKRIVEIKGGSYGDSHEWIERLRYKCVCIRVCTYVDLVCNLSRNSLRMNCDARNPQHRFARNRGKFRAKMTLIIAKFARQWSSTASARLYSTILEFYLKYGLNKGTSRDSSDCEKKTPASPLLLPSVIFFFFIFFTHCSPYSGKSLYSLPSFACVRQRSKKRRLQARTFPVCILSSRASERLYSSVIVIRFEFV